MLHSALPRAFLPPGLSYLGGYYGEDGHVYPTTANYAQCIEDPYGRIADQRIQLGGWENVARSISPCPLDLSLKPPSLSQPARHSSLMDAEECEAIEVDDNEDQLFGHASQRRSLMAKRSYSNSEDLISVMDEARGEIRRSSSVHSYHSYVDVVTAKDRMELESPLALGRSHRENIVRSPITINSYASYEGTPTKKELPDSSDTGFKIHQPYDPSSTSCPISEPNADYYSLTDQRKLLTDSPSHPGSQSYHQQLLLTPQHHLQSIHAPMTPPSTPSPPQCPRRRNRDENDSTTTPRNSSNAHGSTPGKQSGSIGQPEKASQRPKKKHARRLKFDEDTSSPVSGTVILGPDEAVVTGDIDPAFNIVEVTEEARAELAKIENRLGPYQCKLCRQLHEDAFQLAQHRCSRIAHVEYRCPECDKRFSCPANLASHRRWHKPRMPNGENINNASATSNSSITVREPEIACTRCDVKFTRAAALRKHLATQHPEANNNGAMANNNNSNNNDNNSTFDELTISGKPLCVPVSLQLGNASLTNEIP